MTTESTVTQVDRPKRLVRIYFKSPKEDYIFLQDSTTVQSVLASHRRRHLHAFIRESFSATPLSMLEMLIQILHPNIAVIHDAYFHNNQLFVISEYLDLCLLDLQLDSVALEEWEIATIVAEASPLWHPHPGPYAKLQR
ncbi:hypothetical protein F5884DRAFT_741324 [Xylogone sp. PMI_703]|nr:hypothetical protein F5884DRAFT_741324 [Xylogone sp. PMI_703]